MVLVQFIKVKMCEISKYNIFCIFNPTYELQERSEYPALTKDVWNNSLNRFCARAALS